MYINKNIIIITLITLAIFFMIDIGYAKASDGFFISKVSSECKDFNLEFDNANVISILGANKEGTFAKISSDKKSLDLNISDLYYPGAGVTFSVDIVNRSNVTTRLNSISTRGLEGNILKVTGLEEINNTQKILNPEERYTINFTIEWDSNYEHVNDQTIDFGIELNYEQEI